MQEAKVLANDLDRFYKKEKRKKISYIQCQRGLLLFHSFCWLYPKYVKDYFRLLQ